MASAVIGSLRVNLGLDSAQFHDGLKQAQSRLKTVGAQMQKIGAAMSVVGAGLAVAIKGQLNAADEMGKAAQKFGVPIEALSQLAYAGRLSDVSLEQVGTALGRLSKNMVGFGEDADGAVSAFQAVGVSATDAEGNLRPTQEVLFDLANAFAGMADGPAKTAAAMALMGRSGAEMIPLLNGGGDALRRMMQEADALGLTLTQETAGAAEQFNDNLTRLQATFGGLATQVASNLAPVLAQISDLAVRLSEGFRSLSPETQKFASIGVALGIAMGPVVIALGAIVFAIGALGVPLVAAGAAIVALTAALVAFWPEIVAAKDAVIAFGTEALDWIKAKFGELKTFFSTLAAEFMQIGRDVIDGLWAGMKEKWEALKESVAGVASSVGQTFRDILGIQSPSTVFYGFGANLMEGLANGIASASGWVSSELDRVAGAAKGSGQNIASDWQQVAQSLASTNKKMFKASQVFGAAQVAIDAAISAGKVLSDPTIPFWGKFAAVAKVLATGASLVSSIKSTSMGGGGGRRAAGGGGSGASVSMRSQSAERGQNSDRSISPLVVRLEGLGQNDKITGRQLSQLLDSLHAEAGNRGLRLMVAA